MPNDPTNEGHFHAIEFNLQPGLIVSPQRPSPCDSYGYVDVCCLETTVRAMARALPDRCPAGTFQLFGIYLYRVDYQGGEPFICIDVMDGGQGGQPTADGSTLIYPGNGDTPNTPIEVLETRYPLRCRRFGYHPGTEGPGAFRGGLGLVRDIEILEPGIYLQCAIDNVQDPIAKGLHGGRDGAPSCVIARPGTERETTITQRLAFFGPFSPGDLVSVRSGGGGGWGNPCDRDPARVARDVRNGFLSIADAASIYGVVIEQSPDGDILIDEQATGQLRRTHHADPL
jgi:N-methylhydantoinase B